MRMIWLSTGRGSVCHNWLAGNGVGKDVGVGSGQTAGQARFGAVAGNGQNVGEMILFEGNHRTMYFGRLSDADRNSITLPAILPPTPDERLGSVKRSQLAHDDAGNEVAPASEFLGIAEGNLISILAAAIKELKAELDAYKATHP